LKYQSFSPDRIAEFVERPNRFIVSARWENEILKTHCPNPGRLREILLPGRKLILEKSGNPKRKTQWTLVAAEYDGTTIPLFSARANGLVGKLVLPELFSDYSAKPEQTLGDSRVDWLLEKGSTKKWVEVKACTLVEQNRALFPDAPSSRAVKHLKELSTPGLGDSSAVIFAVMNPGAEIFSPNPHTDPDLCIALSQAEKSGVAIKAVSFKTGKNGSSTVYNEELPVDLSTLKLAENDSGVIVRVWASESENSPYKVTVETHLQFLSRAERKKMNEFLLGSFTIRGNPECFHLMTEELSEINFTVNPLHNPGFLSWISDYRHRRVFLNQDSAGIITSM